MKPNFKTTAVAILVALGVSACKSNDPEVSKPSTPTNNQAQQQAKAKAEQEAKAKAEREAKAKAEQAAKAKAEQEAKAKEEAARKAQEEANKAKAEKEKADAAAKQAAEAKAKAEQEARAKEEAARKAREAEEKAKADKAKAEEIAKAEAARKAKEEEARKAKEAADKAKAEADKKAAEAKAKADAERKAAEDKARLEKERAEAAKKAEEERIKAAEREKLAEQEKARLEAEKLAKEKIENEKNAEKARVEKELAQIPVVDEEEWKNSIPVSLVDDGLHDKIFEYPAPYNSSNSNTRSVFQNAFPNVKINLTELTKNDIQNKKGQYLGKHEGTWSSPAIDNFIVKTEINESKGGLVATSVDRKSKDINYIYINNPYSTYGVLFTNGHQQRQFTQRIDSSNYGDLYTHVNNTSELNYVDSLKGNVTYKGDVIATITRGIKNTREGTITETPKVDGTVTLNAYFGDFAEENSIEGKLESNTIGTVELLPIRQGTNTNFRGKVRQLDENGKNRIYDGYDDQYSGRFAGKEANDVVGYITFTYNDTGSLPGYDLGFRHNEDKNGNNPVYKYNAVYGATKQPKAE